MFGNERDDDDDTIYCVNFKVLNNLGMIVS